LDPNVSIVEISEDSRACSFTYDKIKTVSLKILAQMGVSDYNDFKAVPNLVISINDEIVAKTSVFWRCEWTDKDNVSQIMWIDDDSGKMVGLIMNVNEIDKKDLKADKDSPDDSNSDIPEAVMVLVEYCKRNYLADDVRCRKEQDGNYIIEIINKIISKIFVVFSCFNVFPSYNKLVSLILFYLLYSFSYESPLYIIIIISIIFILQLSNYCNTFLHFLQTFLNYFSCLLYISST